METVFFVIGTQPRINFILRTDIFGLLKKRARLVIFSPFSSQSEFRNEFGGPNVFFEDLLPLGKLHAGVISMRNQALNIDHPEINHSKFLHDLITFRYEKGGHFSVSKMALTFTPAFIKRSAEFWDFSENLILRSRSYTKAFKKYRPSAIVTASAGAEGKDIPFLVFGRRFSVPVFAVDNNIDAFTFRYFSELRKGFIFTLFNEEQKREALEIQKLPADRAIVTGAARYDFFVKKFKPLPRRDFLEKIGLDGRKKIITFGAKIPIMYPGSGYIIKLLLDGIRSGKIKEPAQIFVRFDPGHSPDLYKNLLEKNRDLIAFERAEERQDQQHLGNLFCHSNVILSVNSTFNVEAAIFNTPSIWVGFDETTDYKNRSYKEGEASYSISYDSELCQRILKTGGIAFSETPEEMYEDINKYLKNRQLHSRERQILVESINFRNDGRAGERIADFIARTIK